MTAEHYERLRFLVVRKSELIDLVKVRGISSFADDLEKVERELEEHQAKEE